MNLRYLRLVSLLSALAASATAPASPAPSFEAQTLGVDGNVKKVVPVDLDGDGKLDLLAIYSTGQAPHESRWMAVFWNLGGRFNLQPDLTFQPPADAAVFDVGDVDGVAGAEVIYLAADRVEAVSFRGRKQGAATTLVTQTTLFSQAMKGDLPRYAALQDLEGAHSADLLVPGPTTLTVYQHQGASYSRKAELQVKAQANVAVEKAGAQVERGRVIPELTFSTTLPSVIVADANGDGKADLFLIHDNGIQVFDQQPGFEFHSKPDISREFIVRTAEELENGNAQVITVVRDLDGDGKADVLVEKMVQSGISSTTTTFYLFLGRGESFGGTADQTLVTNGYGLSENQLLDVDGDGHPDLIVPSIKLGIMAIIRMLTSKTAKLTFDLFPFQGRRFKTKSTAERTLTFKLDLEGHSDQQAVDVGSDFDGDHHPDLLFAADDDELSFYSGGIAGKLFTDDPVAKVKIRALGNADPVDLEGAGRCDVVLTYSNTSGHRGEIGVVHNLGLTN